jgi:STE24 endopeptidase
LALGPLPTGLIYIVGLLWANDLLGLPFQLHSTFVIEARFGFNRTTPRTFVLDKLKAWALSLVVGGLLLAAMLAFFSYLGSHAWLWAWGFMVGFGLLFQFITPTWILPLFNKFSPLGEGELRTAIFDLANATAFPLSNVLVMDGSKRSSKSNAFFTGFGRNKRIALFDTLIAEHTTVELVAILAHEVGHFKKRHVLIATLLLYLQQGVMLYLFSVILTQPAASVAFGLAIPSVYSGLVIFALLYSPVSSVLGLGLLAMSRRHEYQADAFAAKAVGGPAALSAALKKLAVTNLSQLDPHPFYVLLNYTHPPLVSRLRALKCHG